MSRTRDRLPSARRRYGQDTRKPKLHDENFFSVAFDSKSCSALFGPSPATGFRATRSPANGLSLVSLRA